MNVETTDINNKVAVVYHRVDLDGLMSAAIVNKSFIENNIQAHFIGYNHGDPVPPHIHEYKKIVMVDIAFDKQTMIDIGKNTPILVLDHHITTKDMLLEITNKYQTKINYVMDISHAACEIVYSHYYNDSIPIIVKYLSLYDTFQHIGHPEEKDIMFFQLGMRVNYKDYQSLTYLLQDIETSSQAEYDILNCIKEEGEIVYKSEKIKAELMYKTAFPIQFKEFNVTFLCANAVGINPKLYNLPYHEKHDGFAVFAYRNNKWTFTLYSDITDVSKIAKAYGGGGHKGAAGFVVNSIDEFFMEHQI